MKKSESSQSNKPPACHSLKWKLGREKNDKHISRGRHRRRLREEMKQIKKILLRCLLLNQNKSVEVNFLHGFHSKTPSSAHRCSGGPLTTGRIQGNVNIFSRCY